MSEQQWTLDEARTMLARLEEMLEPAGFHIGLLGSVLHNGSSDNDLDVVIYPHTSVKVDISKAYDALSSFGLKRRTSVYHTMVIWARKGSDDLKHVEVWNTRDKKRIDIFWMQ